MSAPGYPYVMPPVAPPPPPRPRRRRWLVAIVVAWLLVLAGLAVWSVRHDPPTVPEQRDIATALPVLQRATGAMLAAAQGPGRAVALGELHLARGCRITPVRHGIEGTRSVTVYVQADQARAMLDAIAAGLPAAYKPRVAQSGNGSRLGLQADAGGYVAIDADTLADAQTFTLEASTGCRPIAATDRDSADPAPVAPPPAFPGALRAVGATIPSKLDTLTVVCPGGGRASTYAADNLKAPADLGGALQTVVTGTTVVRADPHGWAYRTGEDSVVVTEDGGRLRVSATTACR